MKHLLGTGTWKLEGSFDGVEVLILEDAEGQRVSFNMDEIHARAVMLKWIHDSLKVKQLTDIIDEPKGE